MKRMCGFDPAGSVGAPELARQTRADSDTILSGAVFFVCLSVLKFFARKFKQAGLKKTKNLSQISRYLFRIQHIRLVQAIMADELYEQATAAWRNGEFGSAEELCGACLKLNPEHLLGTSRFGAIMADVGKVKLAERYYKRALEINAEHAPTL